MVRLLNHQGQAEPQPLIKMPGIEPESMSVSINCQGQLDRKSLE
jgi:hypothetical protein